MKRPGILLSLCLSIHLLLCGLLSAVEALELFSAEGTLVVLHGEDQSGREESDLYYLRSSDSIQYQLLGSSPLQLRQMVGQKVRVSGYQLSNTGSGPEIVVTEVSANNSFELQSEATGPTQRKLLIVRVNFADAQVPCDKAWIGRVMWNDPLNVNEFYQAASFGNLSWPKDVDGDGNDDIVETTLAQNVPSTCSWTLLYEWRSLALTAVAAQGVNTSLYQNFVFLLPNEVACGPGHAESGCGDSCNAFLKYCSHPDLYAHELAHTIGLNHARTDANNDGVSDTEYGDASCVMGYSGIGYRHFNAPHKRRMGWIPESSVAVPQETGKINLLATEKNPSADGLTLGATQIVQIPIPSSEGSYYYVSYREKLDAYSEKLSDANRIHIHRGVTAATYSDLITTLGVGETFSDGMGVQVRLEGLLSPYASVLIHFGPASEIPTPVPTATPGVSPEAQQVTFKVLSSRVSYRKIRLKLTKTSTKEAGTFKVNRKFEAKRNLEPGDYQISALGMRAKSPKVNFTVGEVALVIRIK